MEKFIYNPINDKTPAGVASKGKSIIYHLRVSKFVQASLVAFVMHKDGEKEVAYPMTRLYADDRYVHYEYSHKFDSAGFYWYHFEVMLGDKMLRLVKSENLGVVESDSGSDFLQLVAIKESSVDPAFHKGIIYHVFVDRFHRSGSVKAKNGLNLIKNWNTPVGLEYEDGERVNKNCYGGNLKGVIDKLDYLKSLNVSTIYLSPIFEANSSHKYDTADYSKIDSMFGSQEILQELIDKAKRKGMRIIIDGVFNHTGSDSIYFNKLGRYKTVGAYQNPNSKYYSWYEFNKYPDNYSSWWGIKTLPQTREDSGYFDYIAGKSGIINKYMKMGLGGFRLDVVDELSNNFLNAICSAIKKVNPKAYIVGEVWEDASSKISYNERKEYFLGAQLDSVTNYPLKNAILDYVKNGNERGLVNVINLIQEQYPKAIQNNLMNILGTHDTRRVLTILGADEGMGEDYIMTSEERDRGVKLLKLATIIQYTMMGIPTIYYGDEAGSEGGKDPYCRRPYPWGKENTELLDWYKLLGNLRNNKVFDGGDLNIKYASDGVIIYERVKGDSKVLIGINRSEQDFEFILDRQLSDFFTGNIVSGRITIPRDNAVVLW